MYFTMTLSIFIVIYNFKRVSSIAVCQTNNWGSAECYHMKHDEIYCCSHYYILILYITTQGEYQMDYAHAGLSLSDKKQMR